MRKYAIIIFLVVFGRMAALGDVRDDMLERMSVAEADSDWPTAIEVVWEALRADPSNPTNPLLMSNMGMYHHYNGESEKALEMLSMAVEMAPSSVTILSNKGRVETDMGLHKQAVEDFTKALKLDSLYADAYYFRALNYSQTARIEEAVEDFKHFYELRPDNPDALKGIAWTYMIVDDFDNALGVYKRLVELEPSAEAYSMKAICLMRLERLSQAAEDVANGLAIDSENAELWLVKGMLNRRLFRYDDAEADIKKAVSLGADPRVAQSLLK